MPELALHPGLVLIAGALLIPSLRGRWRVAWIVALPLLSLALVWRVPDGAAWQIRLLGYTLTPLQGDKLSRLFATIFALMAFGGGLFALSQKSRLELPAAFVYAGSAIGVALAGDLLTVFVFWELMAMARLWCSGAAAALESYRASLRYLMVHLLGGVLLLAGVTGHIAQTGSVGFGRNGARFDGALADPGRLSGQCRRAAVVGLAAGRLSGSLLERHRVPLGVHDQDGGLRADAGLSGHRARSSGSGLFMVFYGIVYALLENDMRRILAYSIVNQVGFMVTGIGIGTEMALNGAAAHAFTHIIYKALLLMSAGSVLYMTGRRKCSDLGGPVPQHADDDDLRNHRRARDLVVPADIGFHIEVADLSSGD